MMLMAITLIQLQFLMSLIFNHAEKITLTTLRKLKAQKQKIVMLTAYNYPFAQILEESKVTAILVGDSLGMTNWGYPSTLQVTMDDMCQATAAVAKAAPSKFIITDMPFLSYQTSVQTAVLNAGKLLQAGAQAVKLEGARHLEAVSAIINAGIPVLGHLGFVPQSLHQIGGYKVQGNTLEEIKTLSQAACELEKRGVFGIVFELTKQEAIKKLV
ncbi:MAG: 3-methyl-2-oxobutanoate hydroxymethyltransferase [Candidatus Magnetoglobus multicellularis str. Araruama]|uniref:3-methyl-2-oxobutanoate hydroxymethyltransferase n=1 Tax=Candidatus Magnetoglobus multicellularis str. Araruama TaxID=890399 RepID=A0A1V1NTY3_9BACT|nr:MAG: 3-methyl-2-oxobutanoate hydroxymethyltransferase [Candidatus Magnetoglobus multicellularis str. Araruama]